MREQLVAGLADATFDLEDVSVTRAGVHSVVRVIVDRDGGIDLDGVAEASRVVSDLLDAAEEAGESLVAGAYVLEVTSPGVDRPLTEPRHWRRAVGRLVTARDNDGATISGRLVSTDDTGAVLSVPTGPVRKGRPPRLHDIRIGFDQIARATVEVEFTAAEDKDHPVEGSAEVPTEASGETPDDGGRQAGAGSAAGEEMTR